MTLFAVYAQPHVCFSRESVAANGGGGGVRAVLRAQRRCVA